MRYFLELSYFGKNYHGWQWQPNAITVQEVLENALSVLLGEKIAIVGAGRTDAGVHARQLFAHFDSKSLLLNTDELTYRLNAFLPKDIAIRNIHAVYNEAHARFDATARTYEYRIHNVKDPFLTDYSYYFYRDLDVERMNEASKLLPEYNDFECFSKKHTDVKTYNCKIANAGWARDNEKLIFTITADRFLRNMVRAIVGTLLDIGTLKMPVNEISTIIEGKKREYAGASAPAHGLYLTSVEYPPGIFKNNE